MLQKIIISASSFLTIKYNSNQIADLLSIEMSIRLRQGYDLFPMINEN